MTQPHPYGFVHQTQLVRDQKHSAFWIIGAWVLALVSFGYMLPWAIAASRGKSNHLAIGLLNLFLGWTFIGWVVALIMACGAHQAGAVQVASVPVQFAPQQNVSTWGQPQVTATPMPQQLPPPGWYPSPDAPGQQAWWDGKTWTTGRQAIGG
jgi:hypothetical protein